MLLLPMALVGCAGSEDGRDAAFNIDNGSANQPFPENHRA